jgi:hypothetical protein
MGKTWHFISWYSKKPKLTLLLQQGHKKKTQNKILSRKSKENKTRKSENSYGVQS